MDYRAEFERFKKHGGYFQLDFYVFEIKGPDSADFLHRISTQDIKNLKENNGASGAFLEPTGTIISLFTIYRLGRDQFWLATEVKHRDATAAHLEKMHFAENLEIKDISEHIVVLSTQGETVRNIFGPGMPHEPHQIIRTLPQGVRAEAVIASENDFAPAGYHWIVEVSDSGRFKNWFDELGLNQMTENAWELIRRAYGHFTFGVDVTEKNMILEAPVNNSVARNKGCYPGQEVVERVFTYGNISKKVVTLVPTGNPTQYGEESFRDGVKVTGDDGSEAGTITSVMYVPWSGEMFAFALIRKPFFEEGRTLALSTDRAPVKVKLPSGSFQIQRELQKKD